MVTTKKRPAGPGRSRTFGDVVLAVLAGVALVALLGAIPYGLVRFIGNPLPDHVPSLDTLTQSIGTSSLLSILAVVVWLAWAQFALCVAVELKAALSGMSLAVPIPAAGPSQALARSLVATMLLVSAGALTVGQASAASAAVPERAPVASVSVLAAAQPATAQPAVVALATDAVPAASSSAGAKVYVVKASTPTHTDTLWGISERYLGSGQRWAEIVELNKGHVQDDGRKITADGLIRPGWRLVMPADASGPDLVTTGTGTAAAGGEHTVTVHRGDTLSGIAERELGDGDKYPELLEASRDLVQPDGGHLTDPNELFPGQRIVIPGPAAAAPAPAPAPVQQPPASPAPVAPAAPAPKVEPSAPATAQLPAPAASPSATPSTPAPATESPATQAPAPAETTPAPTTADTAQAEHTEQAVSVQQILGIGAGLGAALLGAIAARRLWQHRRRRPGQTIAVPEETAPLEMLLGHTAEPASVALLDLALRTLAERAPDELPALRAARVTEDSLHLLVDDSDLEPVSPFTAGSGGWWVLDERADLLDEQHAARVPAPYPGLLSLGRDEDGVQLLANMPFHQVVLLDGAAEQVREVARAMALDAATCPWADHVDVLTAGFGQDLGPHLPKGRVRFLPSAKDGIVDLAGVLAEAIQAEQADEPGPLPWLMVSTSDPGEQTWELADLLSKARGQQVAVILPASCAEYFPEAEVLDAAELAAQSCELVDGEVVLQRVTEEAHRQLVATFEKAAEPARPAVGPWEFVPDPDAVPPRFGPASVPSPVTFTTAPVAGYAALSGNTATDDAEDEDGVGEEPVDEFDDLEEPDDEYEDGYEPADDAVAETAETPVALTKPARQAPRPPVMAGPGIPQIQVLGPVRIDNTGRPDSSHAAQIAALGAYLYFKPGRDYGSIANAMDPESPWEPQTVLSRISQLRGTLGTAPSGAAYLPRKSGDTYRMSDEVSCDWTVFEYLAERGLPQGVAGLADLEQALDLVRGRPFGGDGEHGWAVPLAQEMIAKIHDTAHTVACLRLRDECLDLDAARRAIAAGIEVQDHEQLFRDWMRVEHAAGNRQGLFTVIDAAKVAAQHQDAPLDQETQRLIKTLLEGQRV
ncbi:LysM peptidoglycan-binding domain-containing protein [Kitasatospora sp. NPDC002227]|uniref:LysM peptidoglycan-binding domain-containing protein n=1 Tax=Kitasatospora sp. NPDC002227 TaxID=3154773 RepID=UPI0033328AA6